MKKLLISAAILCTLGVQGAFAERSLCTDKQLTLSNAREHCEHRCWKEDREFRGWRCGSDNQCGSACTCLCSDHHRKRRDDYDGSRRGRRDDSGAIEIPLGDKLKIQIPVD